MHFEWKKLGNIFSANNYLRHPKLITHAANPLPIHLDNDVYRVFYSGRDIFNRSSVGAVDIDLSQLKVTHSHYNPVFEHGCKESFYADGVSIGNVYSVGSVNYMLFMGWQNPNIGHWRGDIGRLIVTPDLTLELDSPVPFMSCDETDPISLSYPWVQPSPEGGFNMWYGSTNTWDSLNGEMIHVLKYASSKDGTNWQRHGLAIPYELGVAQAFSRPTVIKDADGYHMWFSFRSGTGQKYRIGYANSLDGLVWDRKASSGIDVSESGWDSEMICYPFVFEHKNEFYMLYNGNDFGKTGFGLAVLEKRCD